MTASARIGPRVTSQCARYPPAWESGVAVALLMIMLTSGVLAIGTPSWASRQSWTKPMEEWWPLVKLASQTHKARTAVGLMAFCPRIICALIWHLCNLNHFQAVTSNRALLCVLMHMTGKDRFDYQECPFNVHKPDAGRFRDPSIAAGDYMLGVHLLSMPLPSTFLTI
jgi:hypothetical protein